MVMVKNDCDVNVKCSDVVMKTCNDDKSGVIQGCDGGDVQRH